MATCKDCFHDKACGDVFRYFGSNADYKNQSVEKECKHFKNKADVVEVVHCRDCKHLYELSAIDRRFYCRHHPQGLTGINIIEDNPYCSYGERKCKDG